MTSLTVSIVTYQVNQRLFRNTLDSLSKAVDHAVASKVLSRVKVVVVDNGQDQDHLRKLMHPFSSFEKEIINNPKNVGFGRAHNQALSFSDPRDAFNPKSGCHFTL